MNRFKQRVSCLVLALSLMVGLGLFDNNTNNQYLENTIFTVEVQAKKANVDITYYDSAKTLKNKETVTTYHSNGKKKKVTVYKYNKANQVKYIIKETVYHSTGKLKSLTTYYDNALVKERETRVKEYLTANKYGVITSHILKVDHSKRTREKYFYQKNTKYSSKKEKSLVRIDYYAYNYGTKKQVKTGYSTYKNGKKVKTDILLKNVPYYNQKKEGYLSGCEFFSLRMALAYKGVKVKAETLYNNMNKSMSKPYKKNGVWYWDNPDKMFLGDPKKLMLKDANWGINPKGLLPLATMYRDAKIKENASLTYIQNQLREGNPVIVWGSARFNKPGNFFYFTDTDGNKRFTYGNFHVYLVIGMDDKTVTIKDPYYEGTKVISRSQFKQSYEKYGKKVMSIL